MNSASVMFIYCWACLLQSGLCWATGHGILSTVRFVSPLYVFVFLSDFTSASEFALLTCVDFSIDLYATGHSFWTFLVDLGRMCTSVSCVSLWQLIWHAFCALPLRHVDAYLDCQRAPLLFLSVTHHKSLQMAPDSKEWVIYHSSRGCACSTVYICDFIRISVHFAQ